MCPNGPSQFFHPIFALPSDPCVQWFRDRFKRYFIGSPSLLLRFPFLHLSELSSPSPYPLKSLPRPSVPSLSLSNGDFPSCPLPTSSNFSPLFFNSLDPVLPARYLSQGWGQHFPGASRLSSCRPVLHDVAGILFGNQGKQNTEGALCPGSTGGEDGDSGLRGPALPCPSCETKSQNGD